MNHRTRAVLSLLVLSGAGGCQQRTAVWVRSGSTADNLVLEFGRERGTPGGAAIGAIRIYGCDAPGTGSGAQWVVGPTGGTADVREIKYGETPAGFTSDQGPQPLKPGCYRVDVSGTGKTQFIVEPSGQVREQERSS
jgi:hypothetical protein